MPGSKFVLGELCDMSWDSISYGCKALSGLNTCSFDQMVPRSALGLKLLNYLAIGSAGACIPPDLFSPGTRMICFAISEEVLITVPHC